MTLPRKLVAGTAFLSISLLSGCSSASKTRGELNQLSAQVAKIEVQLNSLTDKVNSTQNHLDAWLGRQTAPALENVKTVGGSAISIYQKAAQLFQNQQYSDSIRVFSEFVKKHPRHDLAGMAQYYVGESYFQQKEYPRAVEEFEQVLTSYDRSPYIAQTLSKLAEAEEQLNRREDAAKHHQLLISLFPHAPVNIIQTAQIPSQNTGTPKFKLDEPPLLEVEK